MGPPPDRLVPLLGYPLIITDLAVVDVAQDAGYTGSCLSEGGF
jgi:hypothetical protein